VNEPVPSGYVVATIVLEPNPYDPYGPPRPQFVLAPMPRDDTYFGAGGSYIGPDGHWITPIEGDVP
jgi:hypothetical protein